MVAATSQSSPAPEVEILEVRSGDGAALDAVADLHMELLGFGPLAGLGKLFIREICYKAHVQDGLLQLALCKVNEQPAGFVAYTAQSISFHRTGLRRHWFYTAWILVLSLLQDPRRLAKLLRAVRVVLSRRAEHDKASDPLGEVVAIAVRPAFSSGRSGHQGGQRISELLVGHAAAYLQRAGVSRMRMVVDAANKAPLFLYHALGASFEPYQQAGEPQVQVWFDLAERPLAADPVTVPEVWSLKATTPIDGSDGWRKYWEEFGDEKRLIEVEAEDYVDRLSPYLNSATLSRVMDFGCGFGYVADLLAPKVETLFLWDAAVGVRSRARLRLARHSNIRFLDLSDAERLPDGRFDLILCHSVIQYMSGEELRFWLTQWRRMLAPEGQILLSDIIPQDRQVLPDLLSILAFSARRGLLFTAIWQGWHEFKRYSGTRCMQPLTTINRESLDEWASVAGLAVEVLPGNFSYRPNRLTARLIRKERNRSQSPADEKGHA